MKYKHYKFLSFMLTLTLVICLVSGYHSTALAEYTITIPSELTVQKSGWNELPGGISAIGTLDSGKSLIITASSDHGFKFVNSSNSNEAISYDFRASETATTPVTKWTFENLSSAQTTQPVGINVENYSGKPYGTYTETVTFTAELKGPIDLSTLTGSEYVAKDGETLTGTLPEGIKIMVAADAHITLKDLTINITNDEYAGITPLGYVTITLEGTNTVSVFGTNSYYPGIFIPKDCTLTIKGDGSLTATSTLAAGIGGVSSSGYNEYLSECGNIVIEGGTIIARGGGGGAGIGGGDRYKCGNITISDTVTKVEATKGANALYSIGAGYGGSCGTVTIGGTVYWNGSNYENGGEAKIGQSTYTYPES